MRVTVVGEPVARVRADILVLGFFEDVRPLPGLVGQMDWLAGGALSRLIVSRQASGRLKEATLIALPSFLTARVLCVGLGKSSAFTYLTLHHIAEALFPLLEGLDVRDAAVEVFGAQACGLDLAIAARTFVKAWYEGTAARPIDLTFVVPKGSHPGQIEQRLQEMGLSPRSR
jgi:hypothetical protein